MTGSFRKCINILVVIVACTIVLGICYILWKIYITNCKKHREKLMLLYDKINKMMPYFSSDEQVKLKRLKIRADIKSYTINKHDMHLCLEDIDGEYYNDNILIYVILHELAHVFCDEIGHTDKYFGIFNKLIEIADRVGIYDKKVMLPSEYCGIKM